MMRISTRVTNIFFVLLLVGQAHADDRTAWIYSDKGATRVYAKLSSGEWVGTHPTKKQTRFNELERDDKQVLIQNKSSMLILRLTSGRAYWRRPADTDWKTYYKGTWGKLPESIARTLPSSKDPTVRKTPDKYLVRAAYFVPADREPVANWEQKIQVILYYVESMFRNDLKLKRLDSDGIHFESVDDKPRVHLIRGKRPASYYNNAPRFEGSGLAIWFTFLVKWSTLVKQETAVQRCMQAPTPAEAERRKQAFAHHAAQLKVVDIPLPKSTNVPQYVYCVIYFATDPDGKISLSPDIFLHGNTDNQVDGWSDENAFEIQLKKFCCEQTQFVIATSCPPGTMRQEVALGFPGRKVRING